MGTTRSKMCRLINHLMSTVERRIPKLLLTSPHHFVFFALKSPISGDNGFLPSNLFNVHSRLFIKSFTDSAELFSTAVDR